MRGLRRDLWKAGIAIAGVLLLLVLMAWIPVSAANAEVRASGFAATATVTVQATPAVDATVTALNKEKLEQELQQLQQSNNRGLGDWLWSNAAAVLSSFLSTLVVVIGALIGFRQWSVGRKDTQQKEADDRTAAQTKELEDRRAERDRRDEEQKRWLEDHKAERGKRAEERFQSAVEGLGSEREEAKVGAAILLRTFLRPGYEEFYTQTLDLAVALLRLRKIESAYPVPLDSLSQALITVWKESFPLTRDWIKKQQGPKEFDPQVLDAASICLCNAYLARADLAEAWIVEASLQYANLTEANLSRANLFGAIFTQAILTKADLSGADLTSANLSRAFLSGANLSGANLSGADLSGAFLLGAFLFGENLTSANLSGANLTSANLSGADLSGAHPENANSLKDTNLREVKGLTKKQLATCKAKGAIIDEDATTSSSQSAVAPSPSSQSNDAQATSAPAAQGSIPTPETGESSAPSSKPGPES